MKLARGGETGLVTRRLPGTHDPVALHAALTAEGAPLLFRRTGGRALILVDSALRFEASGLDATLRASSEGGALLLDGIAVRLGEHLVARGERELSLRFVRSDASDETARAAA
ncbi:MAG: hypothetical protein LH466_04945, partial [Sphingomonas bacterium]|nr:hypothetical protein [Sphingomonas bacterium]